MAIRLILFFSLLAIVLFGSAGRWDLPFAWAYLGVFAGAMLCMLATIDRELLKERVHPGPGGKDRHLRAMAMPLMLVHLVVAGLDVRFGWSMIPDYARVAALVGMPLCFALPIWAIHVNRFFSPVVRIQTERDHQLVDGGPYRWIRHPGYLGSILMVPCAALVLGSLWALLPLVVVEVLMLRRIVIEDAFLREHLDGYTEYAARVRYRLVPGLW